MGQENLFDDQAAQRAIAFGASTASSQAPPLTPSTATKDEEDATLPYKEALAEAMEAYPSLKSSSSDGEWTFEESRPTMGQPETEDDERETPQLDPLQLAATKAV